MLPIACGPNAATGASTRNTEPEHALQQQGHRRHRLGTRPDVDQAVLLPRLGAFLVKMAAPQIDDKFAIERDRNRCAEVAMLGEIILECRFDR